MSEPWEWKVADLDNLIINGVKESLTLDYKQFEALGKSDGKKNEISKDVSAFANSAGGVIIYGMIEQDHVPTALDHGLDPAEISKEWLDQVINSRIQRRIDGVRINPVELVTSHPGRVAYVVWVPQSFRAPHQAADKKFYKRFNFESVPMEEYEIRDVMRRAESPDLDIAFFFDPGWETQIGNLTPAQPGGYSQVVRLYVDVLNRAPVPAEYAVINVLLDHRLRLDPPAGSATPPVESIEVSGQSYKAHRLRFDWKSKDEMPIFEGVNFRLTTPPIRITFPSIGLGATYVLAGVIHSPHSASKKSTYWLRYDGNGASIEKMTDNDPDG